MSLLHALGDEQTRRAVNEAHTAAWQAALAYLEDEACVVRRGTGGVAREHGEGFVAAAYQHRTSRAQEPQLHTHVIVANMACRPSDGKWRALDGEAILKTYRLAAGYLYQAHLRGELSQSLGVEWETPYKGLADVRGVAREVIDEFSTRRMQVVEHMDERGTSGFWAAQVAAWDSRDRKEHVDLVRLREEWRARAAEHGLGRAELDAVMHRVPWQEPSSRELLEIARGLLGPDGLTERSTAFSDPDLVMAWSEAHAQGASAERVRRLAARFVGMNGVEPVGEAAQPGRPARYSTRELLETERAALALVERGIASDAPSVSAEATETTVRETPTLTVGADRDAASRRLEPGSRRLRRRARRQRQDDRHTRRRRRLPSRRVSRCSAPHLQASPPRSCKTRPASPRRPSTGSSSSRSPSAASSSSTRQAWPRPASSPRCSNASSRRRRRSS